MNQCRIIDVGWINQVKNFDVFFAHCPDLVFIAFFDECMTFKQLKSAMDTVTLASKKYTRKKIFIVTDYFYMEKFSTIMPEEFVYVTINQLLLWVYKRIVVDETSKIENTWNPDNTNWVFLLGKLDQQHRLGLLYYFYKQNLLDNCTWSLRFDENRLDDYVKYFPDFTKDQARQWLRAHSRSPDQIQQVKTTAKQLHYGGIPYGNIYQNALFQVISETHIYQHSLVWITEKTWLSILNCRPFMILGNPGTYRALEDLGFDTFSQFLIDQNFDQNLNVEDRFHSLTCNIKHWLKILPMHAKEIAMIAKSNQHRLIELAKLDLQKLTNLIATYHIDTNVYDLTTFTQYPDMAERVEQSKWTNFYNRIKDSAWPACNDERDFVNLPKHIQRECIDVFGYQPRENL